MDGSLLEKARVGRVMALETRRIPEAEPSEPLPRTTLRLVDPILPTAQITNVFADLDDAPEAVAQGQASGAPALSFLRQRVLRSSC